MGDAQPGTRNACGQRPRERRCGFMIHHKLDSLDEHIYPLTGATGKELYPPHRRGVGSKIPEKPEWLRLVAQGRTGEIT
uniref:Uncharacterized protein n=1 Tax=Oryza rufipogon TaxID=4529 RepID=A0A0E0NHK9_ORYRU